MSLINNGDIQGEVLVRNNRTTTDSFITDTMLQDWERMSHVWASSYHKWPFTEGRASTTYVRNEEWNFEGYKSDSIRIMQVGGFQLKKLNFKDYQTYREMEPNGDERVFTDYARTLFINPNIDVTGTLTIWGQYQPTIDPTDLTQETLFSSWDQEGNEALVEKMSGYMKRREHLIQEAELHDQRAVAKLEEIWKRVQDEQYNYQTHRDSGGMFERFDILRGDITDELIKRDQW